MRNHKRALAGPIIQIIDAVEHDTANRAVAR
jgi:hypothetical protein